jgi:hypothetical protein
VFSGGCGSSQVVVSIAGQACHSRSSPVGSPDRIFGHLPVRSCTQARLFKTTISASIGGRDFIWKQSNCLLYRNSLPKLEDFLDCQDFWKVPFHVEE